MCQRKENLANIMAALTWVLFGALQEKGVKMIDISKLYCGSSEPSDRLRYGEASRRPVVVYNCTRRCNLKCLHCYTRSDDTNCSDEMTTDEAKRFINAAADFGTPAILFSGGEPLLRPDIFELIGWSAEKGIRAVLSTNGTLITRNIAKKLKDINLSYAGVSIDGLAKVNNRFRGSEQAFERALNGIRNCMDEGIKVGIRFTINKMNHMDIPGIFTLMRKEGVPRTCFYHLVYSGRGVEMADDDLPHDVMRGVIDQIIDATTQLHKNRVPAEVLTVDNYADGVYLYLRMVREGHPRAADVFHLLHSNGGNLSGVGIACVSWNGDVHPDQFLRDVVFGNVRERDFSEIWMDEGNEILMMFKNKKDHVKGRCSSCKWLSICGGNLRARALAVTGDLWSPDPACYLKDEEIF